MLRYGALHHQCARAPVGFVLRSGILAVLLLPDKKSG